jgi:transposase-like protein
MGKSNVVGLNRPEESSTDALSEIIRVGAQKILQEAIEAEIECFIAKYQEKRLENGEKRIVRNGYLPVREITTGIGKVPVKVPRARDKKGKEAGGEVRFQSGIIPKYLRKTKSLEELIPFLYLKGISAGDMGDALEALVGKDANGFSQPVVSRLKKKWKGEFDTWKQRDLSRKHYVYIWVDGIHLNVRMDDKQCILVVIGATKDGRKELLAVEDGYRESTQSWREVLLGLKKRGLVQAPELVVGDGALGFWKAVSEEFPKTQGQRCWVHKTANILNKMPKNAQPKAKEKIHNIWLAEKKEDAIKAFDHFIKSYESKYPKAVKTLEKDRDRLLTFYDFPAEHWRHIRTTNPIESTFATVRLRTAKVRNCFSRKTVLSMTFKLCQSAEKKWQKLFGYRRLAEVIEGIQFVDGISEKELAA